MAEEVSAETREPEAVKKPVKEPAKKATVKKEPKPEEKAEVKEEPAAGEKKTMNKMVDVKNIPGGVYMPPLTSRSSNDKFTCMYQLRTTADTDKNIRRLAGDLQRSYNFVVNMILEAYFDSLNNQ